MKARPHEPPYAQARKFVRARASVKGRAREIVAGLQRGKQTPAVRDAIAFLRSLVEWG
jgi:hypothetical protein